MSNQRESSAWPQATSTKDAIKKRAGLSPKEKVAKRGRDVIAEEKAKGDPKAKRTQS